MDVVATAIPEVKIITTKAFRDPRGYFTETWNRRDFADAVGDRDFVEDRLYYSRPAGTLRGLHFQAPPAAQDKLVRCLRGRVFDVAVDIRQGSPSYGHHVAAELSGENRRQMLIPAGFAHGYMTLEPETELIVKVTGYYAADQEMGIAWDDPALGIGWPATRGGPLLTAADRNRPRLADLPPVFRFDAGSVAGFR